MYYGRGVLVALIAGAIGCGVWTAITVWSNYEIGWIAWGIGAMVGLGARAGAQGESAGLGFTAAGIAIAAVLLAKLLSFQVLVGRELGEFANDPVADEELLVQLADEVAAEFEESGRRMRWPEGQSVDTALVEADYPPTVWREATKRWDALGEQERQRRRDAANQAQEEFFSSLAKGLRWELFKSMFSGWDILWLMLAGGTAVRLAFDGESPG